MADAAPLRPGDPRHLGGYELTGRLGAGGQGVVYLGRDPGGSPVAVKVLHAQVDTALLEREVRLATRVGAFCTARVLDHSLAADPPYIVSEYIEGPTLREVVEARGPLADGALRRLAIGVATALLAIHEAGVVHRDLKPGNVLAGPDGYRVIDFGIARAPDLTATAGSLRGTPGYMAPEQLSGAPASPASDVFAWGATVLFAATGRSPFGEDTLPAIINRVLHKLPDLSGLPADLRAIVGEALGKDPAARPRGQDLLNRLVRAGLDPAPPPAPPALAGPVPEPPTTRFPVPGTIPGPMPGTIPGPVPAPVPGARRLLPAAVIAGAVLVAAAVVGGAVLVANGSGSGGNGTPGTAVSTGTGATAPSGAGAAGGGTSPAASAPATLDAGPGTDTAAPAGNGVPAELAGGWSGTGLQPTSVRHPSYEVRVTLAAGTADGGTYYPGLGCAGTLTFRSYDGGRLLMQEHITGGTCTDTGVFTFWRTAGAATLSFTYDPPNNGHSPASAGTLSRN